MHAPDREFDPDDNFEITRTHSRDHADQVEHDEEAGVDALAWQLLLLVNPGDEDTALRQFEVWREASAGADDEAPVQRLGEAIDWVSGFRVDAADPATFIDAVTELAARWNLDIDWGVEDRFDDEFLAGAEVPALMAVAYDRLREYGYTLWTWRAPGGADDHASHAGWITLSRDDDALRALAPLLGIELRPGSDAF